MFKWLDRRKHIRRDQDMQDRMNEAVEAKHKAALEALEKLKQFTSERRTKDEPYYGPERRAHA
jgi:hypothetical protein